MSLRPMERITTQTLLGIRFWDSLLTRAIASGLYVKAQRLSDDRSQRLGKPVIGRVTPSGVVAFFGLSSLEALPAGTDSQLWDVEPPPQDVVIDLHDRRGRYLPLSFVVQMPQRGAWRGRGTWQTTPLMRPIPDDPTNDAGVMLWSAAARPPVGGMAVIRAQLITESDVPLAYALVQVEQPAELAPVNTSYTHYAITDHEGKLNLIVPYPPIPPPANGAGDDRDGGRGRGRGGNRGNGGGNASAIYPPLDTQTFTLDVRVWHDEAQQIILPGSTVPELESILTQPPRQVGTHWDSAARNTLTVTDTLRTALQFGQTLILRTRLGESLTADSESVLRIQ